MAKLQAKTEEQQERIKDLFSEGLLDSFYFDIDKEWVEIPCSYDKDVSNYITFDTMAKIVDYLRFPNWKNREQEIAKYEEYNRLLDENRKLNDAYFKLKKENDALKEKTKRLSRIATLNKRIHELKQENERLLREQNNKQTMVTRKFCENDTYEFYDTRGTYSDAEEVQKVLKDKYGKDGTLQLDHVYGWIVRVKK